MNVTLIGTGEMARSIGVRLVRGGHSVTVLGRDENDAEVLAQDLRDLARGDASVRAGWLALARLRDEIVVLAIPHGRAVALADRLRDQLAGRIVVDVTNQRRNASKHGHYVSGAEEIAQCLPPSATLVKAFNTVSAATLLIGQAGGEPLDVLIAGDDPRAKEKIAQLARDAGMAPLDVGPLRSARDLEGLARITRAVVRQGPESAEPLAWKLVRKQRGSK